MNDIRLKCTLAQALQVRSSLEKIPIHGAGAAILAKYFIFFSRLIRIQSYEKPLNVIHINPINLTYYSVVSSFHVSCRDSMEFLS